MVISTTDVLVKLVCPCILLIICRNATGALTALSPLLLKMYCDTKQNSYNHFLNPRLEFII